MCASWNNEYDQRLLIDSLNARKTKDASGRVGFTGWEVDDYLTVLRSSVNFLARLPEMERRRIVRQAVFSVAQTGTLTTKTLLAEISKKENNFLRLPYKRLVLATSISIRYFDSLTPKQVNGARITFSASLPKRFGRVDILKRARRNDITDTPRNYAQVRVSVRARSESEAANLALDAFDLLRGIWNLALNHTVMGRKSSGRPRPVNEILPGPLHTLHEPNGNTASDTYWYEPNFPHKAFEILDVEDKWKRIREMESQMRERLASKKHRWELEDALRGYAKALDQRDFNNSFLSLWSLLERLTNTLLDNYKVTVRRAIFLFKDRDFHLQILNHLKSYRNRAVHAGEETEEIEALVYQLKLYVEQLLFFHIYNTLGFLSMRETADFLDLPPNASVLKGRIKLFQKAVLFHR